MRRLRTMLPFMVALAIVSLISACGGLSSKQKDAASDALKALRKVDAATQVGISYFQYQPLVIEAQAQVNEALAVLPDGELKKEISLAMEAYTDANIAFKVQGFILSPSVAGVNQEAEFLVKKYSLPPYAPLSNPTSTVVRREDALSAIWKAARTHIDRASSLL